MKKRLNEMLKGIKSATKQQIIVCFIGVFGMGFFLSFLLMLTLGTDPCSFMNDAISRRIGWSFGNWQLLLNTTLLILVIAFRPGLIGFGTFFNMVLIGYYADFFCWVWGNVLPAVWFTDAPARYILFAITLACFIVSAAVYMNCGIGLSPYDAIAKMLSEKLKMIPFFIVRIAYDGAAVLIGMAVGGKPGIGHVLMALLLGPVIAIVGKKMSRLFSGGKKPVSA